MVASERRFGYINREIMVKLGREGPEGTAGVMWVLRLRYWERMRRGRRKKWVKALWKKEMTNFVFVNEDNTHRLTHSSILAYKAYKRSINHTWFSKYTSHAHTKHAWRCWWNLNSKLWTSRYTTKPFLWERKGEKINVESKIR